MIYFIQRGKSGPIKIGYTSKDDIRSRLSNLQSANPEKLSLLGIIDGDKEREQQLHRLFSPYKVSGEWFDAEPKIVIYLLGLILGREISAPDKPIDAWNGKLSLPSFLASQEKRIIQSTLERNFWNITRSAKDLGVTFRALRYSIDKYNLKRTPPDKR